MKDKKTEGSMPKVSKKITDLPPSPNADAKIKGGVRNSVDGETMGGGTTTTGDSTIPM